VIWNIKRQPPATANPHTYPSSPAPTAGITPAQRYSANPRLKKKDRLAAVSAKIRTLEIEKPQAFARGFGLSRGLADQYLARIGVPQSNL